MNLVDGASSGQQGDQPGQPAEPHAGAKLKARPDRPAFRRRHQQAQFAVGVQVALAEREEVPVTPGEPGA
ncbi:hypothetical protein [Nonomuraea sp. NPDC048901]|uniref:hypothetical protein n=1 Tax=Nonomuraea sp. NPDC048901 TaxID=3155627 RepID=UPI0033D649F3